MKANGADSAEVAAPEPQLRSLAASTRPRNRAFDGLRGAAVLAVVGYHVAPNVVPGGFLGVDVFFVLSGYLITSLLLREWAATGRVWIGGFYARRALRLFPALAAFLVGLLLYGALVDRDFLAVTIGWLPLVYLTNVLTAFDLGAVAHGHIWSLAAEEQFYLLWPPILIGLLSRRTPRSVIVAVTAVGALIPVIATFVMWDHGVGWVRLYYGPDTHAAPILVGCLLGELATWRLIPVWPRLGHAAVAATVFLAVATFWLRPSEAFLYVGGYGLVALAAALLVLGLVKVPRLAALFSGAGLVKIGGLSYAIYLWHPLLLQIVGQSMWRRVLAAACAYPLAKLSMKLIEAPCLALKGRFTPRRVQPEPIEQVVAWRPLLLGERPGSGSGSATGDHSYPSGHGFG